MKRTVFGTKSRVIIIFLVNTVHRYVGQRHAKYLKRHHRVRYINLLTSGKLNSYLADIDKQAQELFDRLMKQRAELEGITETLKAGNQMEWVRRMNALRSAVTETVNAEVIFV